MAGGPAREGVYVDPPERAEAEAKGAFDFSHGLRFLRAGVAIRRAGWNGKGMWLGYCAGSRLTIHGGELARYTEAISQPCIVMKTADGKFVPWLASQTDLLAADWEALPRT